MGASLATKTALAQRRSIRAALEMTNAASATPSIAASAHGVTGPPVTATAFVVARGPLKRQTISAENHASGQCVKPKSAYPPAHTKIALGLIGRSGALALALAAVA